MHNPKLEILGCDTIGVKGTVKVHHPVLGASDGDGLLDLGPLSDEISKRLRLDRRPPSKFNGVSAELDSPLDEKRFYKLRNELNILDFSDMC